MDINKRFPIGSIVIHKKNKNRYVILNRNDFSYPPFHVFYLKRLGNCKKPFSDYGYLDFKEKFVLAGGEK